MKSPAPEFNGASISLCLASTLIGGGNSYGSTRLTGDDDGVSPERQTPSDAALGSVASHRVLLAAAAGEAAKTRRIRTASFELFAQ